MIISVKYNSTWQRSLSNNFGGVDQGRRGPVGRVVTSNTETFSLPKMTSLIRIKMIGIFWQKMCLNKPVSNIIKALGSENTTLELY